MATDVETDVAGAGNDVLGAAGKLREAEGIDRFSSEWLSDKTRTDTRLTGRIAAWLVLIDRKAESGPAAATALMRWAQNDDMPIKARMAAGLKAVELSDDVSRLVDWAQNIYLPMLVRERAGLKAIGKADTKEKIDALWRLDYPLMPENVVNARCMKLRGMVNPLARGGVLSEGTVPAPAAGTQKERGRGRVAA
jgi:hypothetical protein